ncbi:DsbA family oxidoreductase [Hephaestia sp. GCM10023244]|uniref:DsbA family oxidoreductase n=1 Tax=unclassified Hephaestia TaxID=2631281 RepID=UPI002076D94E|nr:DsbA family oxidoreductase [Hephaestia sp. MAHUQ-44]MCM8732442.1 DsbA family oxidoreductase [Hephaestia sp. MAHUQ-44]
MPQKLKIDFISDIACPWCVIGLLGLEKALDSLKGEIEADITFHPFELNPDMPAGGENGFEHISTKYGMSPDQVRENRARIRDRAADIGFTMNTSDSSRVYNTFDAHRLIAWAGEKGHQLEMKRQLFTLYFTNQQDTGNRDALAAAAETVGLDGAEAREILASDRYTDQVRAEEMLWRQRGISSVPAVVVDDRYLISGGQPPDEFARQLRGISAQLLGEQPSVAVGT